MPSPARPCSSGPAAIPVDGDVTEAAAVDESAITGEPMPAEKAPGGRVFAGTVARTASCTSRSPVSAPTPRSPASSSGSRKRRRRRPRPADDRTLREWYTPAIIALAVVAAFTRDIELALTLLVIGCPGALVIATPVAIVAGIGRAARRGILIKGGEHLETVGRVTAVAVDKTGTLTEGKPVLTTVIALVPARAEDEVLRWPPIAEVGSGHPLAARSWPPPASRTRCPRPRSLTSTPAWASGPAGGAQDRRRDRRLLEEPASRRHGRRSRSSPAADGRQDRHARRRGRAAIGILGVSDVPAKVSRSHRRPARLGIRRLAMLTGDNHGAAEAIAAQVGISEVHAGLLPEDKLA